MAATIDATVGGASANSYVTQEDADTYFEGRLNADEWVAAAFPVEALIMATRLLDRERYKGARATDTQALQWPRDGVEKPDLEVLTWYGTDEIPQRVKDAQCEVALYLLNQGATDPTQPTGLEQFESVKVGALDVTPRGTFKGSAITDDIKRILRPLLRVGENGVRLVRG